jgi:thymidylate synthase
MNKSLDKQYQDLLRTIMFYGVDKNDRTGTGTKSIFGYTIRHNMADGFPLLTTKKMYFKGIVTELMWFLLGDTNIKYLVENGCNIWNGDAYKKYADSHTIPGNPNGRTLSEQLDSVIPIEHSRESFIEKIKTDDEFAKKWGELGPIYGKQWRDFNGVDQIKEIIETLRINPNSRRILLSSWAVDKLDDMTLPPCHYGFQLYVREDKYLSLMWNQRSVDTFLGLPFNIASYGLLLEMIAKEVNMIPDQLIGNLGDVHLYNNHIEQTKELIKREPRQLPKLKMLSGHNLKAALYFHKDKIHLDEFLLLGYDPHPAIKAPLSN